MEHPRVDTRLTGPKPGNSRGTMNGLHRVAFRFGRDLEVRYVRDIPAPGDRVGHRYELWAVRSVSQDETGVIVICGLPRANRSSD